MCCISISTLGRCQPLKTPAKPITEPMFLVSPAKAMHPVSDCRINPSVGTVCYVCTAENFTPANSKGRRKQIILDLGFNAYLLQTCILSLQFFPSGYQRNTHDTEFGAPFLKNQDADPKLTAHIGNSNPVLGMIQNHHELAVGKP